ncbi:putative nuclease HARBI1 [Dreissena polymorpha]|uniref:putative nuclease HARBI1 n=1 Tax=Dreissena polymorpha TaxID=45954 RepID=UPI002265690A|nr:putative nuclease HARBI1 [Dreissena polymorpha]XP_052215380.1 putative nuclease HARBI1 [Dreissena polymorpha]
MRFTDVVSRWPGATHDAAVFDSSGVKEYLSTNDVGHLLGDSGYPLRTYLMTPVPHPSNDGEQAYNDHLCRGRIVVERAFGVLKSRFR